MFNVFEITKRALNGPLCSEKDFDLKIFVPELRRIIQKYGIKYDPENPVPSDDDLADSIFKAGVELYSKVGTYCPDTERIIKFTEEEIYEALKLAPSRPVFGEGKEAKELISRKPESDIPPWCFLGAGGAPVSNDELFVSILEAYGSFLPLADSITTPTIVTINGNLIRAGSPLEVMACIKSSTLAREALRSSGRPGLPIMNSIATAVTDTAKVAGSQFGLRPSDGWLIGTSSELKLEFQRLNEIAYVTSIGGHIVADTAPILGGYCGGPEGVAVTNVAYHLNCIMAMQGSCQLSLPFHYSSNCTTTRDVCWVVSTSSQAISRNSHFPLFILSYTASGPMTKMCFYEIAAAITTSVVSGASIEFGGVAKATATDYFTPMEPKFASEVAHSVVGLKRKDANTIVKKLLTKYEDKIINAPLGKKYAECWETKSKSPLPEYIDLYEDVKKEISGCGLKFKY